MVPARTLKNMAVLLAIGLACVACGPKQPSKEQVARDNAAFQATQQPWRAERLAKLMQTDGWTSLVGLHWLEPGTHRVGSDADNGIRIAKGPHHLGVFTIRGKRVGFVADTLVVVDGRPLSGATSLRTDADAQGASTIVFDGGKGQASVIERGGRLALRVKHADAVTRLRFSGLTYWPGGQEWQVSGRFVPHAAGKTLQVGNIIGTTELVPNPGAVEFERDGKAYRIEALDQGDGGLFLVFADRTSGHGSYGAGRFLDAPRPDAQGRVLLDFNHAYNPPCAFTLFATCPLPPLENRLDLAIEAGERNYVKPKS